MGQPDRQHERVRTAFRAPADLPLTRLFLIFVCFHLCLLDCSPIPVRDTFVRRPILIIDEFLTQYSVSIFAPLISSPLLSLCAYPRTHTHMFRLSSFLYL